MDTNLNESTVRLGRWFIDPDRLSVSDNDTQHRVRPKDMLVLVCLVRSAPAVVSRSALLDAGWPRGYVDGAVLGNAISRLRRVLDGTGESIIETVPRKGYRVRVAVQQVVTPTAPAWNAGSPYRGLRSFNEEYSAVFFGRNAEVTEVLSRLKAQSEAGRGFMVLLGPSGTGKTSLIDAGIIPALKCSEDPLLKADWRILRLPLVDMGKDPTGDLVMRLVRELGLDETAIADWEDSGRTTDTLVDIVSARSLASPAPTPRFLLVLDPLEAFLTDIDCNGCAEDFFDVLYELTRSGLFWVIAGLRNKCYADFCRSPALMAMKHERGQFDLKVPDNAQLGRVIREPARLAGLRFEKEPVGNTTLDETMLAFAITHPSILPLLQFTLDELYSTCGADRMLTFTAYEALGSLHGSMARRAEQVYDSLEATVQEELPFVLGKLVRVTGDREIDFSRRFQEYSELADTPEKQILIEQFVDARLFVSDVVDDVPVVAVAHESVFRYWGRASEILDDNRELLALSSRVRVASSAWLREGRSAKFLLASGPSQEASALLRSNLVTTTATERDFVLASVNHERDRARRRRWVTATFACLALLSIGLAVTSIFQRHQAQQETERAQVITNFVTGLFELADPVQATAGETSAKQIVDLGARQLTVRADLSPSVRAALLQTIGQVYVSLGQYEIAAEKLTEALKLREASASPTQLAETLNSLGKLHYQLSEYDTAHDLYRKALAALDLDGQSVTPEYAKAQNNLAELAAAQGEYEEALQLHRSALVLRERLFGHDSSESASSLQNIAGVLRRNGDHAAAEAHYRKAIALQERFLGPKHAEVGTARANLGLLLTEAGKPAEAERQLRLALAIRQDVFGSHHPQTANSLHNLAALLFSQEDYVRAEPVLRESLQLHSQIFGNAHVSVAYSSNNLATLLLETDRAAEAAKHFQLAFDILTDILGDTHPNTALIRANLSKVTLSTGQPQLAAEHARRALDVLAGALPEDHWRLAVVRSIYGSALAELSQFDRARELLMASKAALVVSHGQDSPTVARVDLRIARLESLEKVSGLF